MNVSPVSFAKVGKTNFKGADMPETFKRPEKEYSPHQTLWNAYGDSFVKLNAYDKQILILSERIYNEGDTEEKEKLNRLREALMAQRDSALAEYNECKEKLYAYRAEHGIEGM